MDVVEPAAVKTDATESQAQAQGLADVSLSSRLLRPRTAISFLIAAAVVVFAFSRLNLNLRDVLIEMSHANPMYLGIAFVSYYSALALRAFRWQTLLKSADIQPGEGKKIPGYPGLSVIFGISWFVNCIVPAKLGDAYRGYLLKERARASFTATLGTIFAERLVDLMTLAAFLAGSAYLVFGRNLPSVVSSWMTFAVALGVVLVSGTVLVFRFRTHLRGWVPERVRHHYVHLEQGVVGSFSRIPVVLLLTGAIWLLEGVRLYFVSVSVHAGVGPLGALFVALLASLLTVVPLTPAGLGFVEVGVVGVLSLMGAAQQTAASVALLDRVVAYWSVIVVGAVLYLVTRWRWR
ncbi:MAG TPA: lysylphosphatidylglycerol synthase transmembrane domain-containing protein [Thermomicrobiaceae bacterium]|nr:lysylphosphatidylglycerol synthase transmembrane domain-containing protein [Thermomicrobiaceae bacterium]